MKTQNTKQEKTMNKRNKATKCKKCGKRRVCDDNGFCKKECAAKEEHAKTLARQAYVESVSVEPTDPRATPSGDFSQSETCKGCGGNEHEGPCAQSNELADDMPGHDANELAAIEAETEAEMNKEEKDKMNKIRILVTNLRATLAHMREKVEFAKDVKKSGNNEQLLTALTNSFKALLGEAKLMMALYNKCTKRTVEVVVVSDPHSTGWSVEMQLPDLTDHLVLRTFRYKNTLDVKADAQAKRVCNAAAWKYFSAEEVDSTYWTEL